MKLFKSALAVAALACAMGTLAQAHGRLPGSLLLYPIYDSAPGSGTVLSITNTKDDPSFNPATNLNSVTDVHFIYIDGYYWTETNRFERLTPNDEFTVTANYHNPNSEKGFMYAVALNPVTQEPWDFDYLIGDEIIVDSIGQFLYALTPIRFCAKTGEGNNTDVDADGILDLDGTEYEQVADVMMIPSFIGDGAFHPILILVSLVGDSDYESTLDFEVFNNNEQEFSATYKFRCWAEVRLADIDQIFTSAFLATTNYDASEILGSVFQTGWARIDGDKAVDVVGNEPKIIDPPFVGAFVQQLGVTPFATGNLLHESDALNKTNGVLDALK